MIGALSYLGLIVGVVVGAWWLRRWWAPVDSYYEREHKDPPIFDAGGFLGGDRGLW